MIECKKMTFREVEVQGWAHREAASSYHLTGFNTFHVHHVKKGKNNIDWCEFSGLSFFFSRIQCVYDSSRHDFITRMHSYLTFVLSVEAWALFITFEGHLIDRFVVIST